MTTDPRWLRYVILLNRTGQPLSAELLKGHIRHLRELAKKGQLELCGPFQDQKGGMAVVKASSLAEAQLIAQADPFVAEGFSTFELRVWELSCEENDHLGAGSLP